MSRLNKLSMVAIGALMALMATSTLALAQQNTATATSNTSATIIAAITITNTADLNFGSVVAGSGAGTVVQTAVASPVRSATGTVTLGSALAVSPATFTVTGEPNNTYAITLPSTPITITSGLNTMTIDTFASTPGTTGTLSGAGAQTVYVGGKLHVGAAQATGVYSGTFDVTVTYN